MPRTVAAATSPHEATTLGAKPAANKPTLEHPNPPRPTRRRRVDRVKLAARCICVQTTLDLHQNILESG
jgi:hypothetical protein